MKLLSLEQRREIQLLTLMDKHKNTFNARHIFQRATRGAERYKFEMSGIILYKNSPYHKGSELWDSLPRDVIESACLSEFKRNLLNGYRNYRNT